MSGFKDTFTKSSETDDLLGYDDAAFYYFASSVLVTLAVPWTYYFVKGTIFGGIGEPQDVAGRSKSGSTQVTCKTSTMVNKLEEEGKRGGQRSCGVGWCFQLVVLAAMWFSIYFVFTQMGVEEVMGFNPFKILEVEPTASAADIKKAYRKMSLVYHPDKNTNDPAAASVFIQITKAYNALTDPVAKANYEKYGNPDGPQMTKVGIGLPKFLLEKGNHLKILAAFFFLLLFVIPTTAICYYQRTKNYAANGVLIETLQFMEHYITETTRVKNGADLLAASAESRNMPTRMDDQPAMTKLKSQVDQHMKPKFPNHPAIVKNSILLMAHMQRLHELMTPELRSDLNELLKHSSKITQAMIEYACARDWFHTATSMIDFKRSLVQALDVKSHQLLQIPHFDEEILRHCLRGKNATTTLTGFLSKPAEERKGLKCLTPEQILDIEAFALHLSSVEMMAEISVEDESEVVVGDIATVTVQMKRTNLRENEAAGPVHAPFFPEAKYEEWWLFLTEPSPGNKVIAMERVRDADQFVETKLRFQVLGRPGKRKLELHAWNDSYVGIDKKLELTLDVLEENESKREIFIHKEDEELDLIPTLFQQLMGDFGQLDEESEDEHEPDDSKAGKAGKASAKEAKAKANGAKEEKAGAVDDGDEESDAEHEAQAKGKGKDKDGEASSGSSSDSD